MTSAHKIESILVAASCEPVTLGDNAVRAWLQQWRHAYAGELFDETGKWVLNEFDWHVFSFGKCPHKQGDRAWSAFRRIAPGPFLVLSAYTRKTFGFTCSGAPPERLDCSVDILVAPHSMEWTMAFNHERYGPYFAVTR